MYFCLTSLERKALFGGTANNSYSRLMDNAKTRPGMFLSCNVLYFKGLLWFPNRSASNNCKVYVLYSQKKKIKCKHHENISFILEVFTYYTNEIRLTKLFQFKLCSIVHLLDSWSGLQLPMSPYRTGGNKQWMDG